MASDFELVETQALSVAAASITFASLGAFRHLQLVASARLSRAAVSGDCLIQFNGDSGANYTRDLMGANGNATNMFGDESYPPVTSGRIGVVTAALGPVNEASPIVAFFPGYRNTVFHKVVTARFGFRDGVLSGNHLVVLQTSVWKPAAVAAITSILLFPTDGNFVAGSVFSLYGMR